MSLATVRVVKVGTLLAEPGADERYITLRTLLGVGGGSTVTLITSESGGLILVDTGFDREWDMSEENLRRNSQSLECALRSAGIRLDDVDVVFLTHHHLDHAGNLYLFTSAEWIGPKPLEGRISGLRGVDEGEEISPGVRVVYTPGHVQAHASLLVEAKLEGEVWGFLTVTRARVAVAGDAIISESWLRSDEVYSLNRDFYSEEEARRSAHVLAKWAEIVIPGHGLPFSTRHWRAVAAGVASSDSAARDKKSLT